jgi:hypothetical protein
MKRLFLILMLVVLPFQISWAAAASYCQHEQGKASQHFGHHDHKHNVSPSAKKDKSEPGKIDPDCGYCHLSSAYILPVTATPILFVPDSMPVDIRFPSYLSHIPDGLIRPDWQAAS